MFEFRNDHGMSVWLLLIVNQGMSVWLLVNAIEEVVHVS